MSGDAFIDAKRRHRRVLHGKAKHAAGLAEKIASGLSAPANQGATDAAAPVNELRPVLASLRKSTLESNGTHAHLVASGLSDLSTAFEKLAQSQQASSPESAYGHLVQGKLALDNAIRKAEKAGDAWPL